MRELNPKRQKNGGFVVYFRNPLKRGKTVTIGLGTRDEIIARSICRDAVLIFNNEDVLFHPTPEKIVGYDPLAVKMVFGEEKAARLLEKADAIQQPISREEASQIWQAVEMMGHDSKRIPRRGEPEETVKPWSIYLRKVGYSPKNYEMLIGLCERQRKELVVTRDENTRLRAELEKLTKKHNVNIKTTIAEAFEEFQRHYKDNHADQTYRENVRYIGSFIQFLPEDGQTRLGTIDTGDIDRWVDSLKGENDLTLKPRTKRNRRNAVSTFFSFAISRFGLGDNPLSRCRPIAGVTRQMNEIRAIDRQSDLSALSKALEDEPYWKAWVLFAIFAGPRFSEQKHCKLGDVFIGEDGDYVKLRARKTGRIRNVPIEETTLLPVLTAHFERRKIERDQPDATENEKSDWLFPANVPAGKKEKSLPGT
ncbi:MAG: site-specific integrase, partial [Acidobacteriota bacterium]